MDSYKSIVESFIHAGANNKTKVNVIPVKAEDLTKGTTGNLKNVSGILVAPGFGERGIEGKLEAVKYARENNIPFLGICLGMQIAVIEFARNVLKMENANSTEFDSKTPYPVIDLMQEQVNLINKGGTMRLGLYECTLDEDSKTAEYYAATKIQERHRHRYEFNNKYLDQFEAKGMKAVGKNEISGLVEVMEYKEHPFFIGVQFHPEYKSRVVKPHPLFIAFVKAALKKKESNS
jgi:CTP synthase